MLILAPARRLLATAAAVVALAFSLVATGPAAAQERFDYEAMTEAEREAFGDAVRSYLLANPETIFDAIQVLEERRREQAENADRDLVAQYRGALFDTDYSHVAGNPEGDITIVEFLDYRCGFCKRAHPAVKEVLERDPNIRLIVKEFPILGPDSVTAGRMAMAAHRIAPDNYAELNDRLMTFNGQLNETAAYRIAAQVGYDIEELKTLANSDEIERELNQVYQLAQALRIEGTPSFIVGDQIVRGFLPADQMLAAIESERAAN
ncbi:MAG: DsbA family protein [Pseudomonadota bacterium]